MLKEAVNLVQDCVVLCTNALHCCSLHAGIASYEHDQMYDQGHSCKQVKYGGRKSKVEIHG